MIQRKLLPLVLLAALSACNNAPSEPVTASGKAKTPSDGTLLGDVKGAITDCGADELIRVASFQPRLVLLELVDKNASNEGQPGYDKFTCVFQAAIALKDTLAVWNQKNIVVNRGKI
jgi:hypothetical protein